MSAMASQIIGVSIVCSTMWSGADQRKYQSFASLALMRGIHRWPMDSPHKGPVTRKCFHLTTSSCSLSLGHSYMYPSTSKITLMDTGKIKPQQSTTNVNPVYVGIHICVHIYSLVPGRYGSNHKTVISEHTLRIHFMDTCEIALMWMTQNTYDNKQRFLTPGHQGWNDLHSLCRIGMEYYLLNNDDNNIIYWIMMMMITMMMIIIMMTMMIIGTTTIMIMIIIITTTLTMTIMKMIMIKTAQTPYQSLYQDRRI